MLNGTAKNELKIEHIRTEADLENLRQAWDDLHHHSPIRDVFLSWEWLFAWWTYHQDNKELWLLAVWDKEQLAGLAPLMLVHRKKYGHHFRILRSLGFPECDVSGFLIREGDEQVLEALCNYLVDRHDEWDSIQLTEFEADISQTGSIRNFFHRSGFGSYSKTTQHLYLPIEGRDWETFFGRMPKKYQEHFERRERRAEEAGQLTYLWVKGQQVEWSHFRTIFEINRCGHYPELYNTRNERNFHRKLLELMQGREWIEIQILSLDGTPLAFLYGFEFEKRYEAWRVGFDQSYRKLALGKVLMRKVFEDYVTAKYREIDFLRGVHGHKTDWNPLSREYAEIRFAKPANWAAYLAYVGLPALKKRLKSFLKN
jgi:CelD/BcsL family acetyltransferase involved in cellulose biosynthesis